MENPTIAMIVPYRFVPPVNGGHRAAYGFAQYLSRAADFHCISTASNDATKAEFPLTRLLPDGPSKYFSPAVLLRLYRYFREHKIQYVVLHQHFIGILLLPLILLTSVKFIVYAQNIEYQRFKSLHRWYWPIIYLSEWMVYKLAWRVQFISPDDLPIAVQQFGLKPTNCGITPYGTDQQQSPTEADLATARKEVAEAHQYSPDEKLIIFFGPQTYQPNLEAVDRIIHHLNPWLLENMQEPYRIMICGGGLPKSYNKLANYKAKNIDYLGFVPDIELYVKASDLMINPINTGGGVKTKVIEAIALGKTVISSYTGALGVDAKACGQKLIRVEDEDYLAYGQAIKSALQQPPSPTPSSFYQLYHWPNALQSLVEVIRHTA